MNTNLIATAWTSADNTSPTQNPPTSPVPIAERLEVIAAAGYAGFGLIAEDLPQPPGGRGAAAGRRHRADSPLDRPPHPSVVSRASSLRSTRSPTS